MLIKEIVNSLNGKKRLTILDVGGHPGVLSEFLPEHDCIVIDLLKIEKGDRLQGSATSLPFQDNSFDLVISTDVFEHISTQQRESFLNELERTSRNFIIIGAPFWSHEVEDAEKKVMDFIRNKLHGYNKYLDEHAKFGLPSIKMIKDFSDKKKLFIYEYNNGYLPNWITMMELVHELGYVDQAFETTLNEFYNKFCYENDNVEPSYRKIALLSKKKLSSENILVQRKTSPKPIQEISELVKSLINTINTDPFSDIKDPIGLLSALYQKRKDLQKSFPEVEKGQYERLIHWASNVANGNYQDSHEKLIEKYKEWLKQELEKGITNSLLSSQKQEAEEKAAILSGQKQEAEEKAAILSSQKQEAEEKAAILSSQKQEAEEKAAILSGQKQEAEEKAAILSGQKQEAEEKAAILSSQNKMIHEKLETLNQQSGKLRDDLSQITNENNLIKNSLAWMVTQKLNRFITKYFPANSRRGRLVTLAVLFVKTSLGKGFIAANKMAKSELEQRGLSIFSKDAGSIHSIRLKQSLQYEMVKYENMRSEVKEFKYKPLISIVMPVYNVDKKWLDLAVESVSSQIYENWELCMVDDGSTEKHIKSSLKSYAEKDNRIKIAFLEKNQGIAVASNKAMSMTTGEFVGLLDNDDELYPNSLFEVIELLNTNRNLDIIYSDENHVNEKGERIDPFYKPDYSPDLLLCCHYMAHFIVFRKNLLEQVGFFRLGFDGAQDYDLILRAVEKTNKIGHVQRLLYGWRNITTSVAGNLNAKPYANINATKAIKDALTRRNLRAEPILIKELGYFHVKYEITANPLVSLIIVTHDRIDLLDRLLESIETKSTYKNYEIIIVDRKSEKSYTLDYLSKLKHKVFRYEHELNISDAINFGAQYVKGQYLIYMNDDLEVITPDWIEAMLEHCQRKEVGIVGCCLIYPNSEETRENISSETIQHAGIVLGIGGIAGHAFRHVPHTENGYYALNKTVRNYNGVTGACAMIRRDVFDEIGGYDTNLKVSYMDVDLCLRVREKGYLIVYTPYAQLYHYESATRRKLDPPEDAKFLLKRWNHIFMKRDQYYNVNLSLLAENFAPSFCPIPIEITPLALLLEMYWARDDLPRAFPEVKQGNYANLIKWAATYGISSENYGLPDDQHGPILRHYKDWYISNASIDDNKISLKKQQLVDLK